MPNVMGREFPYTPQGMAAAQQYRQALGMRNGGPMGFRPVRMQTGGDARNANTEIYLRLQKALALSPAELNNFLYENTGALKAMADENPARAAQLADAMEQSGFEGFMRNLMQGADQVPRPSETLGVYGSEPPVPQMQVPPQEQIPPPVPQMQIPPRGMSDFPGYQPGNQQGTGDFYPPGYQQEEQTPIPGPMNRGGLMSLRRR